MQRKCELISYDFFFCNAFLMVECKLAKCEQSCTSVFSKGTLAALHATFVSHKYHTRFVMPRRDGFFGGPSYAWRRRHLSLRNQTYRDSAGSL